MKRKVINTSISAIDAVDLESFCFKHGISSYRLLSLLVLDFINGPSPRRRLQELLEIEREENRFTALLEAAEAGAHAAAASCPAQAETPEPELQEAHADAAGV